MLLKKQTVWLLTMLSLVIVLSVYYMTAPPQSDYAQSLPDENETADATQGDEQDAEQPPAEDDASAAPGDEEQGVEDGNTTMEEEVFFSSVGSNEQFTAMRLELNEARSKQIESFEEQIASQDLTSEERNGAYNEMVELQNLESKEAIIETRLRQEGFKDALVRVEGSDVNVTVISEEQTKHLANQVMATVREELGQNTFAVVEMKPAE
ncbi:SpoIIIAH-like family protein [Aureibacillus halotolerans]|uniref:Stage III sporulation protein AH n=1 Tax=Aureibacillus halotolerans TaxID=1508390 RepID=A0A4R6U9X6_9BACI|nr:SpoIIIAH-like family protein [Aureibacillus halotolerans]TDQ41649.1 stage III sporulation protein AH [Aureibacillus halotolerans]